MTTPRETGALKAVLFDKDGTLFNFTDTWAYYCDRMVDRLARNDDLLKDRLAAAVGFDRKRRVFVTGSLIVNASADEVNEAWLDLLPGKSSEEIVSLNLEIYADLPVFPTCDLTDVMTSLRTQGLKLGVATNDYEAGAVAQLQRAAASSLFDFVCGSDSGYGRKPEAGMVHGFCELMDIAPHEVVFVGDSTHDMDCARNANVGLSVAVLTGPATEDQLTGHADVILPSIESLPDGMPTSSCRPSRAFRTISAGCRHKFMPRPGSGSALTGFRYPPALARLATVRSRAMYLFVTGTLFSTTPVAHFGMRFRS
ncbi:HAD family hydrolase [Roseibium sp.]|uniref:HAD family hydrolase n=1 Tax=Roseibium sp. TaxID=1936156 RepID=UPI003D136E1B